jgi:hypothetical protein
VCSSDLTFELFVGPQFAERVVWGVAPGHGTVDVPVGGIAIGLVTRRSAKIGLSLSYEGPLRFFGSGAFVLGVGFLYDVGGEGTGRDGDVALPPPPRAVQLPGERLTD